MHKQRSLKRFLALMLTLAMMMALALPAHAVEGEGGDLGGVPDGYHAAVADHTLADFTTGEGDDAAVQETCQQELTDEEGAETGTLCACTLEEFQQACSHDGVDATEGGTCENCGKKIEAAPPAHEADEDRWESDETNHWRPCTVEGCTEEHKYETAEHNVDDWTTTKEPTATEAGEQTGTCSVCTKELTKEVPATGMTEPAHNKTDTHTKADFEKDGELQNVCTKDCGLTLAEFQAACTDESHPTADKPGTCGNCGLKIDDTEPDPAEHQHTVADDAEWQMDETAHWHACSDAECTEDDVTKLPDYAAHDQAGADGVCSECGYDPNEGKTCDHAAKTAQPIADDAGYHQYYCDECNEPVGEKEACVDEDGDKKCDACEGDMPVVPCTHENTTATPLEGDDVGYHKVVCDDCEEVVIEKEACNTKGDNGECSVCGYKAPPHPAGYEHAFADYVKQDDGSYKCKADDCDSVITASAYYELCPNHAGHANILPAAKCITCGAPGTHEHEYYTAGDAAEGKTIYGYNETQHWFVCKLDGCPVGTFTALTGGSAANHAFVANDDGELICVCGYEHVHAWATDWSQDETHHWHECTVAGCSVADDSEKGSYGVHEYDADRTCACGDVKAYVPVEAEVTATLDGDGVATVTDVAIEDAIDTAREETGVEPDSPVDVTIDMGATATELKLTADVIGVLAEASTVTVGEGDDQRQVEVPVTITVESGAGTVVLPLEALTEAQDGEKDVVLEIKANTDDLSGVAGSVDVTDAVAADVTLYTVNGSEKAPASIAGLQEDIQITLTVPAGAEDVTVYYVDAQDGLVKVGTFVADGTKVTFEVNHLTTFVMVAHTHTFPTGGGLTKDSYENNVTQHWLLCTECGATGDKSDHTWGTGANALTCTVCGYVKAHVHDWGAQNGTCAGAGECTGCDEDHSRLTPSDTCYVCGFVGTKHVHTWAAAWGNNATHHWHECTADNCDVTDDADKNGYAAHTYGAWTVDTPATTTVAGSRHRDCTECGYTQTETIPATGGGSGGTYVPARPSNTVTNPDGSTTTTTTDYRTGAVTETTKRTDGTTVVKVTQKDGSSVTTTTTKNGVVATVTTSAAGQVAAEVKLPEAVVNDADGQAIVLPIADIPVTDDMATAAAVTINTGKTENVKVAIPATDVGFGTVAVIVHANGLTEVVKASVPTDGGVTVTVPGGTTVRLINIVRDFADVPDEVWYEDAVTFVAARGLFAGTGDNMFSPDMPMNRAMMMTVLARLAGANTSGGDTWYQKGLEWAMANGISDGSSPNSDISREQLVTMIWRFMGSPDADADLSDYVDADQISSYANDAMTWAVQNGIVSGYGDGHLGPRDRATRAQVAQVIANLLIKLDLPQ